jgi:hypothetical protein
LLATDWLILKGPTTTNIQATVVSVSAGSAVFRVCNGSSANATGGAGDVIRYIIVR